jgi:DNA-binding response OmpR family regulator
MARVLLVENDSVWLDLIRRALPEYEVDGVQTYDGAMALLRADVPYDAAIVDINLLPRGRDRLGGRLLEYLRDKHPSVRRIALTGEPPTAVRAVLDKYDPDDLLLKDNIDLSIMRDVVEAALRRAANEAPDSFRDARVKLRNSLHEWKESVVLRMEQRVQALRNDVRYAEYLGEKADGLASELTALEVGQRSLAADSDRLTAMVAAISSLEAVEQAHEAFSRLQAKYGI